MWRILQQETPEDYVIATGVTTYIRDFVRMSFAEVGIELEFEGEQENEIAKVKACNNPEYQIEIGKVVVRVDLKYHFHFQYRELLHLYFYIFLKIYK
jgi:GDPmannose 4,6-dehydratase